MLISNTLDVGWQRDTIAYATSACDHAFCALWVALESRLANWARLMLHTAWADKNLSLGFDTRHPDVLAASLESRLDQPMALCIDGLPARLKRAAKDAD